MFSGLLRENIESVAHLGARVGGMFARLLASGRLGSYLGADDRRVLETIVFPHVAEAGEFSKILFVGCRWYTMRYSKLFEGKNFWTLDIDPRQRRYGSRNHIVDSLENVGRHFPDDALDLIICNGVFGWGLNAKPDVEEALSGCHRCLHEGGVLLLGWNDIPKRRPFPLQECRNMALFDPWVFPPLSASEYLTDTRNRHTYNFYVKPGKKRSADSNQRSAVSGQR